MSIDTRVRLNSLTVDYQNDKVEMIFGHCNQKSSDLIVVNTVNELKLLKESGILDGWIEYDLFIEKIVLNSLK